MLKLKTLTLFKTVSLLATIYLGMVIAPSVQAQQYPTRSLHIVIGFPPGGAIDTIARVIAPKMSAELGQAVVVEDKGILDSLRRSQDLVRGAWWTVFLAWLLIQVVTGLAQLAIGILGAAVLSGLDGTALAWGEGIWSTLTQLVVQPFGLIAIAILYADRLLRVDGRLPGPR